MFLPYQRLYIIILRISTIIALNGIVFCFIGNNHDMARTIDYISASILILFVTFVWAFFLFENLAASLIFSVAFTVVAIVSARYISKKKNKPYSADRLALEFCIRGNDYIVKLLLSAIKNDKIENGCNYILLENSAIIADFKFSALTISDMCSICNLAKKLERKSVFVITKGIDRKAFQIANIENVRVRTIKIKEVYRFLKKHDSLPDLKRVKQKPSISLIVQTVLSRQNFKNYAFSGAVLTLVSFITPLKVYYLILGSISVLLALLCLTPLGKGELTTQKALDRLEYEAQDEYRRE